MSRPHDHLRALLVLLAGSALLLGAPPGLDFLTTKQLRDPALLQAGGPVWAAVARAELRWRRPAAERLAPIEHTFRIAQTWSLYRDGPSHVRRLEVQVDGQTVYRTGDPDADWRAAQFGNRRFRPMVETVSTSADALNWKGIGRFIVARAREDFPDAHAVRIVATRTPFGQDAARETHARRAAAPDWKLRAEDLR